jgi:uncharacterized protein DUF6580
MKFNKSTLAAFILLIITATLYRIWDGRPEGFVPHIAMAIFGGAIVRDQKNYLGFILPLLLIFVSDVLYEILWINKISPIPGFYEGQVVNYILFAGLTLFGFLMKKINLKNVTGFSISGSVLFFIISNFAVWADHSGLQRPLTFNGLLLCYGDAIAFYRDYGLIRGFVANSVLGDLFFSYILFGGYYLVKRYVLKADVKLVASSK